MLLLFVGFLLGVVELDFALQHGTVGPIIGRALLVLLLRLLVLLLAWGLDNAIAPPPGNACAKSNAHPFLDGLPGPFHDNVDIVERFSFARDQGTRVSLLKCRVLKHGKPYPRGPLDQRVVRVEVEQIPVAAGGADAQDILERLFVVRLCRERFDL
jgi:hypothetical protein